jgi:hypothetical protein
MLLIVIPIWFAGQRFSALLLSQFQPVFPSLRANLLGAERACARY